ncbi:MAG: zinc ABC transporter substrate-binding protein [Prolixibacteraceae bacterium]
MKNFAYLFILLLFACQPKQNETTDLVSVSILPQKYFTDRISGGLLQVNVLVPPGASPHDYSVLPSQMKALSKSKVWLQIGLLSFEEVWNDKFADMNKDLRIVNCSEGIDPIAGSDEHETEDPEHDHGGGIDPHIWLAPNDAKILAKNTLIALKSGFPEHAEAFEKNFIQLTAEMDSLSNEIEQELASMPNRSFLIFHPTLGYFARQFQLEQIPLELDGKEPSPRHMKDIVDVARRKNIHTILIQKEFDTENALQLSREIEGKVVVIDPLDYDWEKQIREISQNIAARK